MRTQFVDPSPDTKPPTASEPQKVVRRKVKKAFYSDDEDESEDEEVEEGYDQMRAFNTTFNALGLNNSLVPSSPEKEKEVRA